MAKRLNIQLPPAVGAFASLFKARPPMDGKGDAKFELTLLYPKSNAKVLDGLMAAAKQVAQETWGDKADAVMKRLKYPIIKDGNEKDEEKYPEFQDHFYVSLKSKRQPGVVGVVDGTKQLVFEDSEAYSGCTFVAAVSVYSYDNAFGKGIGLGLDNVLVVKKGERMGGGPRSAESEFADYNVE
jgi:hypothetical protein